jgi:hypothetical protein
VQPQVAGRSNEWPRSMNDCWFVDEDASELSYEAGRGGEGF